VQECEHYIPENPRWNPRRRQKKKAAIVARPYTPEDDALIQELRGKGVPCTVIADRMGRSRSSIYRRIARLKEENHTWAKELVGVE
jgi:IS30 family transposase